MQLGCVFPLIRRCQLAKPPRILTKTFQRSWILMPALHEKNLESIQTSHYLKVKLPLSVSNLMLGYVASFTSAVSAVSLDSLACDTMSYLWVRPGPSFKLLEVWIYGFWFFVFWEKYLELWGTNNSTTHDSWRATIMNANGACAMRGPSSLHCQTIPKALRS